MISVEIIDFTNAEHRRKSYGGANGKKISVIYNNELYMLKFPSFAKQNKDMSYSNSCFSEYLGCKIFESIGIPAQKTLIGTYKSKDKEKIVVACLDFTRPGIVLQDFASFKNQIIDSENNGYGTELKYILETFENQSILDPIKLQEHFWDMFIVDALIGNWDRHNGNWGFLYNAETDEVSLAPIYDCGSSLYPQADVDIMKKTLTDGNEMDLRIFDIPTSAIRVNNNRIHYYDFISSLANKECNKALLRISPKINLNKIERIIDETPFISDLQKNFYKTMIGERKTRILDYSSNLLKEREITIDKRIENKNFYDAYLLAKANIDTSIANSNIPLEFMKEVIKEYGANAHIINSAVNVAADVENESTEFAAKLLNDTLNSKEYRKAFEESQSKAEENTR